MAEGAGGEIDNPQDKAAKPLPAPPPLKGKKAAGKRKGKPGKKGGKPAKKPAVRKEFSAGFVLFRDTPEGRRWLVLDYGRHWDYPKGHLEKGETAWQAAVRELREETGIKQVDRVGAFKREMTYWFYSPKKGRVHKTVTFFVGRTRAEAVKLSDEHAGYAWLPFEDAMARLTFENARDMLAAAHEALESQDARREAS